MTIEERVARLTQRNRRLRAALLAVEWSASPGGNGICPSCHGYGPTWDSAYEQPVLGHRPGCRLNAALGRADGGAPA